LSFNPANDSSSGFTKANEAVNYYFWLSGLQPTVDERQNPDKEPANACSTYGLDNVQFSYPLAPDNRVLKGVSMTASLSYTAQNEASAYTITYMMTD
jgi:ATP-binding cassette subfamily B (MDR/TAP) protein 1